MTTLQGGPKKKVLGRGLGAIIPRATMGASSGSGGLFQCRIDEIQPNKEQPRQNFDEQKLQELTESIRSKGIIHPLIVRKHDQGYQIIAGERRWRAAKIAGLDTVPVMVKELSESEVYELALIENIQREDLNPLEEAEAYRQLIEDHGLTQEELARRVGKQRSSVANLLRLLKLPLEVRQYMLTGELTMGHARAVLAVSGATSQISLARRAVHEKLSVRQCEEIARMAPEAKEKVRKKPRQHEYSQSDFRLIESLQRTFGTKVDLKRGNKGGKIIVHYYSEQELDRILQAVEGR